MSLPDLSQAQQTSMDERVGDWMYIGGDVGSQRSSELSQITGSNFEDLDVSWEWDGGSFGNVLARPTPIYVDGMLITVAGERRYVVAIDAGTGETLWMYRMNEGRRGEEAPRPTAGRGVAYWTDGSEARIFLVTPGYHLVALDAKTGRPCQDFGQSPVCAQDGPNQRGVAWTVHCGANFVF